MKAATGKGERALVDLHSGVPGLTLFLVLWIFFFPPLGMSSKVLGSVQATETVTRELPKVGKDARCLSWYKLKQELKVSPLFDGLGMTIQLSKRSVRDDLESGASPAMRV